MKFEGMATSAFDITPDDDNNLATPASGLFVGTGGDLVIEIGGSDAVTMKNIPDGTFLPIVATKVWDTDTTAEDIIGFITF